MLLDPPSLSCGVCGAAGSLYEEEERNEGNANEKIDWISYAKIYSATQRNDDYEAKENGE